MTTSFVLEGSESLVEHMGGLTDDMNVGLAMNRAAAMLADKLRDNTPPGYNKRLPDSVIHVAKSPEEHLIGYESGVEKAGGPEFDSVTRPRTRGRSVISRPRREWVDSDRLASVLEQTFDDYADPSVRSVADGIARSLA